MALLNTPFWVQQGKRAGREPESYSVQICLEGGAWVAETIAAACPGFRRIALVTDSNVAALHARPVVSELLKLGCRVSEHVIQAGETHKSLQSCAQLYDALVEAQLDRDDILLALGGGLVGDVTGFVASTYLRGIRYVHIPTTTLAAVDASVGAKTAINTDRGKNLVGTFHAPQAVCIAMAYLASQTPRQHASGLVEALKMAVTLNVAFFSAMQQRTAALLAGSSVALAEIIGQAVGHKSWVVGQDGQDRGIRAILNFGHTVGHAIEMGENFRLLHGEAVALGMVAETQWAESMGLSRGVLQPLKEVLLAMNMPVDWRRANLHLGALKCDKKRTGNKVTLPVVPEVGCTRLHSVPLAKLVAFVTDG